MTKTEKKLKQAALYAAELMIEHDLNDWIFKLKQSHRVLGATNLTKRTISLSEAFILSANKEDFRGIVLHEIAHALLPRNVHHGPLFARKCAELVGNDKYTRPHAPVSLYKYTLTCGRCGTVSKANSKRKYLCTACLHQDGVRSNFVATRNTPEVVIW